MTVRQADSSREGIRSHLKDKQTIEQVLSIQESYKLMKDHKEQSEGTVETCSSSQTNIITSECNSLVKINNITLEQSVTKNKPASQ